MSTKQRSPASTSAAPAAPSTETASAVRQPAGNAAAVERAGLGGARAGELRGDIGAGINWAWTAAKDMLGLDTDETEDGWDLAKQTADNLAAAQEKLAELAGYARDAGLTDVAARVSGAAEKLAAPAGLATDLTNLMGQAEKVALVQRLLATTSAVMEVDLRAPEAAGAFDAWFATLGEVGEEIADQGGMWGAALKPFASFVKLFGENNLFAFVKKSYGTMHGTRDPDSPYSRVMRENDEEGL